MHATTFRPDRHLPHRLWCFFRGSAQLACIAAAFICLLLARRRVPTRMPGQPGWQERADDSCPPDRQTAASPPPGSPATTSRRKMYASETVLPGVPEALRIVPRRGAGAARMAIECAPVTTSVRKPGNARRPIRISSRRCC